MNEKVRMLSTYIDNIQLAVENQKFNEKKMTVEHRSNNSKRDFLFVNKVQGKHIPTKPSDFIEVIDELAYVINTKSFIEKKKANNKFSVLVVGFAETATSIAENLAKRLVGHGEMVITTREPEMDKLATKLLTFEEEHSHATTQNIYFSIKEDTREVKDVLKNYSYVLFVDDEISTGNTIINFMNEFRKVDGCEHLEFGVASICNWQNDSDKEKFKQIGIERFYLIGGELKDKNMKMDTSSVYTIGALQLRYNKENTVNVHKVHTGNNVFCNLRTLHYPSESAYAAEVAALDIISDEIGIKADGAKKKIRVLGTEEFMYSPMEIAMQLEAWGHDVKCHASTRSKIDIMSKVNLNDLMDESRNVYELITEPSNERIDCCYKFPSIYEEGRDNYIYNINDCVDYVIVVTDRMPTDEVMRYYTNLFEEQGFCTYGNIHFIVFTD